MIARTLGGVALVLLATGAAPRTPVPAWPHRAILKSIGNKPVAFRAYTLGGTLIIAVDGAGNRTTNPDAIPRLKAIAEHDTVDAETPADFPLDLYQGPVVFVARDSLQLFVGANPYGQVNQVSANGRRFTVSLVDAKFVIDSK